MWLLMLVGVVGFWVAVVVGVRMLVGPGRNTPPAEADPLRLLDVRLARGEIDAAAYRELRRLITEGH
jgi:uncharacterized membrane protein